MNMDSVFILIYTTQPLSNVTDFLEFAVKINIFPLDVTDFLSLLYW